VARSPSLDAQQARIQRWIAVANGRSVKALRELALEAIGLERVRHRRAVMQWVRAQRINATKDDQRLVRRQLLIEVWDDAGRPPGWNAADACRGVTAKYQQHGPVADPRTWRRDWAWVKLHT
jgi:hypothetical protein